MRKRYFIINAKTDIMHIQGYCEHTKPRKVPIRLFENEAEMQAYAGRPLRLCKVCEKKQAQMK
ncbi:MAG: hypothetical protein IJY91_07170 [Oscillospiraceae bacterium]|nr:hypothetical protein [Oscillospiraceae bacterium]